MIDIQTSERTCCGVGLPWPWMLPHSMQYLQDDTARAAFSKVNADWTSDCRATKVHGADLSARPVSHLSHRPFREVQTFVIRSENHRYSSQQKLKNSGNQKRITPTRTGPCRCR